MNGLRWILLTAGVVLIAAIYIWGKRSRGAAVTDMNTAPRKQMIPQLDEVIPGSKRAVDSPVVARTAAPDFRDDFNSDNFNSDSLPPMHTSDHRAASGSTTQFTEQSVIKTSIESREPRIGEVGGDEWSRTGAHKAEPTLSESVMAAANFSQTGSQRSFKVSAASQAGSLTNDSAVAIDAPTAAVAPPKKIVAKRKIIALRLSAGAIPVDGSRLKSMLEASGLRHGKYSIYHCLHDADTALFSVASMVEPGTFDPFAMSGQPFPGVTLFAQLPGPIDGMEIFSRMLSCARELERAIGGILQDERGLPLTEQREERLRDDIADFLHLLGAQ